MELEKLVSQLVQKIIQEMKQPCDTKNTLVLVNTSHGMDSSLLAQLNQTRKLFFLEDDRKNVRFHDYLVPEMTCTQMVDIALGRASDFITQLILDRLLGGQTVTVVEYAYKKYLDTAPEALLRTYEGYERQLTDVGIRGFEYQDRQTLRLRQKVVTQQDLAAVVQQSRSLIQVAKDTQITPLAIEFARDQGIDIQRR